MRGDRRAMTDGRRAMTGDRRTASSEQETADTDRLTRRTALAAAATGAGTALAGCLFGDAPSDGGGTDDTEATGTTAAGAEFETNGDFPPDENPADGYPPAFDETPGERAVDTDSFDTVTRNGVEVPLAPVDVAHYWYRRREARFADARGTEQYTTSHVYGAVLSPAGYDGDDDPVLDWPQDERIVCYCGCPHHLSSIRAADLIESGHEEVYVIDEGFWEWHARDYAMRGTDLSQTPYARVVSGETPARYAGETVWVRHDPSGQREATTIGSDGRYSVTLRFHDVGPSEPVVVETPAYTVEAPLGQLADTTVTADTA